MKVSLAKIKTKRGELLAVRVDGKYFIDQDGTVWKPNQIESYTGTRGTPENVREAFFEMAKWYATYGKAMEKYEAMKKEQEALLRSISGKMSDSVIQLRKAQGCLSKREFADAFYNALPENLQRHLTQYEYLVTADPDYITYSDHHLYVYRHAMIGKYMRSLPFVYEEYDGNVFMADDAEKDLHYKNYVKRFTRPLQGVKAKLKEGLSLGDKDSLHYCGYYDITLDPKRTLNAEYAAELAAKFYPLFRKKAS